jgi:hypothetical protein
MKWVTCFLTVHFKVVEDAHPPENHTAESNFEPESAVNPVKFSDRARTGHGEREADI